MRLVKCCFEMGDEEDDHEETIMFLDEFPKRGDYFDFSFHENKELVDQSFIVKDRNWSYDEHGNITLIIFFKRV